MQITALTVPPSLFAVFESAISNFTCRRVWDGHTYFSFEVNWTIPPHWASRDVIDNFRVRPSFDTTGDIYGTVGFNLMVRQNASYYHPVNC